MHGRDELAALAQHGDRGRGLVQHDLDAALVGRGPHPLNGVGHDQVDQHRLAWRRLLGLDAGEVEQVVDDAADPEGLVVDAAGQPLGHVGVGLGDQCLGQQAQGAHRRLELVADVGHEVAADLFEPASLGDVLDEGDDPERAAAVVDLAGPHLQGAPGRAVEIERALGRALVPGVLEQLGHRLGGQGVAMPARPSGRWPGRCGRSPCRSRRRGRRPGSAYRASAGGGWRRRWTRPPPGRPPPVTCSR